MTDWQPFDERDLLARAPSLADCWEELRPKLPADRRWHAGELPIESVGDWLHTPCEAFRILSRGSGSLRRTAALLAAGSEFQGEAAGPASRIRAIAAGLELERLGMLALGSNDLQHGPFMLLDGNHRATALLLAPDHGVRSLQVVVAQSARPLAPW